MKVPINPDTEAPAGALGYEKPVDISAGTRALGEVVSKWADYADQQQKKRQMFDVEQKVVNETNDLSQDFEAKKTAQPLGAPNFVQQVNGEYNTRHQAMVQQLKDQGYSPDAVHEFAQRLGTIRAQYVAQAIDFQTKSEFSKTLNDANQMAISLSQYAQTNPNAVNSALSSLRTGLSFSGLEQPEQEQIYNAHKGEITKSAQDGFALQHPEVVLGLYGLNKTSTVNYPDGTTTSITTQPTKPSGQLADNIVQGLKNRGLTDAQARGVAAGIAAESSNNVTAYNASGGGNGAYGLGQWRGPRQASLFKLYGSKPTGSQQLDFLVSELNGGDPAGKTVLSQADEVAVLHSYINDFMRPSTAARQTDLKNGLAALGQQVAEHAATTAATLVNPPPIPANWRGNQEDAIRELGMTADQASTYLSTGKDTRVPTPSPQVSQTSTQPSVQVDEQGKTGIPVLDGASGIEREQMVVLARKVMDEREADAKTNQAQAHETWLNSFYNDLQDGKLGQVDLDNAYKNGQITNFDERKKAQGIIDANNDDNDSLKLFNNMLHQGGKFNPFDSDAQKAADAGFAQTVKWAQTNDKANYNPFAIAVAEWQRVGILPKQGAVMMRGALIGTDSAQVAAAASVASNMLKQNPNAFAGVDGGEEIGKAAANYTHYVDDLGMPAQAAANKIALANSPEYQAKLQANRPAREQFVTSIVGDGKNNAGVDIQKTLNDAILGPRGWGSTLTLHAFDPAHGTMTGPQTAEARQTYLELALENYDKFGDPAAAQAYATQQMSRFYGIESGRMMKYPATKAYPEIMGSNEYVFDQAKQFVDKAAGFSVPKEDISLMPTATGSTADAFRNGKAPPYQVVYVTRTNGQPVYHTIPDKVFVADVGEARTAAAAAARKIELQHRNTVVFPGIGEVP